jgi:hypothetical protein
MTDVKKITTYTLAQVSEMTGYPLRTLEHGCRAGRIDHEKFGRKRVLTEEQVAALLEQHRRPVVEPAPAPETAKDTDRRRALARLGRGAA